MKKDKNDNSNTGVSVDGTGRVVNLVKQMNKESFANKVIIRVPALTDARIDSILNRPKTETYELNEGENIGVTLRTSNYTHTAAEKKRDNANRKHRGNIPK
jgi:cell division FtsZ-interacting protein ZapD